MHKIKEKTENRQGKRRLISLSECMADLKNHLPELNDCFNEAVNLYNEEIIKTPIQSRVRGFEASLFNSKLLQCIQEKYPRNWNYGIYKRFLLHIEEYIILIKKLNSKGKPMNIATRHVGAISNQLSLDLFGDSSDINKPIIYFGYKKNRLGLLIEPQIVYIDDGEVSFSIQLSNNNEYPLLNKSSMVSSDPNIKTEAEPKIKNQIRRKKDDNK